MSSRTNRALLASALLACAACAAVGGPAPGPSPFRKVKKLVLVRRVDDPRAPRARDAIDALKESLDERGYEVRVVEVGRGEDGELRELERLEDQIASRLWTHARTSGRAEWLGADAGALVAKHGADAIAGYHRLEDRLPPLAPPPSSWGSPFPPPPTAAPARRPSGALSLLAADGSVAWFPWGGQGAELDPGALLNPAEAIDAVLAALAGDAGEDG